jgi:hypothetical protein
VTGIAAFGNSPLFPPLFAQKTVLYSRRADFLPSNFIYIPKVLYGAEAEAWKLVFQSSANPRPLRLFELRSSSLSSKLRFLRPPVVRTLSSWCGATVVHSGDRVRRGKPRCRIASDSL